jgi:hypothetical protein
MSKLLLTLLIALTAFSTYAQQVAGAAQSDPLQKPKIWAQLENDPYNKSLWVQYMSKPWLALSVQEREQIAEWRKMLSKIRASNEMATSEEEIWAEQTEADREELVAQLKMEIAQFHQMLEKHLLGETEVVRDLKGNIEANFVILEDIYELEFQELGGSYQRYADVNPDGKLSKSTWIEQKSAELENMKKAAIDKLTTQAAN